MLRVEQARDAVDALLETEQHFLERGEIATEERILPVHGRQERE